MFYIIGVGLSKNQITLEGMDAIKKSKEVFLDNYTNILSEGDVLDLEKIIDKKINLLDRKELEQEKGFLKDENALLVIGNPTSATTHFSLIEDLNSKKIDYKIIPGISIFNYRGFFGLSEYRFGKTVSIVFPQKNYFPTSFYNSIEDNLKINAHTLCLLDIIVSENRFMSAYQACEILEKIDVKNTLKNKECLVIAGAGSDNQKIISFTFKDYKKINIEQKPQTLVICSELNEFEKVSIDEYRL